ncbi:alpha/beta fold hydrolase [Streptomyces cocklensis]|uniref:NADH-flavin reductase n=1 Tax=Actinacidiphila cocklensis TaxID=887465 RepID=A0A9W4DJA4_9ACTN|nr:alpha/beta fold hydrolase [Actinacidiphila cocklensis]MDD1058580.1 alpha/beta fold hydrolase [Actinacidiphila cocklensis]CAG6390751.1 Putative NADH-flavin reductase [Actinacidiphila cocklensis]
MSRHDQHAQHDDHGRHDHGRHDHGLPAVARITHRFAQVGDVRVFYREAGPRDRPTLLLLHGFPSGSHQFRRLFDVLGTRFHLIAPDYPGFGHTEVPDGFPYSFDALADTVEGFVDAVGLTRFVLYAFDFGGPVGFRLAARRPEAVAGLVVQNANAYDEGLSEMARGMVAARPGVPGAREQVQRILTLAATRGQYEGGTADPASVAPDGWTLDQHFLDLPGRKEAQIDLALDYHTNVEQYPRWQEWMRTHRPPALVLWGRNDAFFPPAGAEAYLRDLPDAELHLLDTGHFALEERLPEIAPLLDRFLDRIGRNPAPQPAGAAVAPLRIAVIGASGDLGGAAAREAADRGHHVTALTSKDLDAADPAMVEQAVAGHDAVVVAVKGPDGLVPRTAQALLTALPRAGVDRLVFLGGGGTLEYEPGRRFVDAPDFPAAYLETARDQAAALDILRGSDSPLKWTYVSPPPVHLEPGPKTGRYRTEARDTPLTDSEGRSRISTGDYAAAVLDAVEQPVFVHQRFTAAY